MYSINFPSMFTNSRTLLLKDKDAIKSNLRLLFLSDRSALLGDPYYGTIIKRLIFNQNDVILRDILIDEIYTCILTFMPQLSVERKNIIITSRNENLYASITYTYLPDNQVDLYEINLTSEE